MSRIGLITDIHEDVERLRQAWLAFDGCGVDRVICLGDVFESGQRLTETAALLSARPVDCIWGNHDFGLCWQPDRDLETLYPLATLSHFTQYRPAMTVDDCFFSHVPAHRDPYDLEELWDTGGPESSLGDNSLSFSSRPERILFMGHHHSWVLATEAGALAWNPSEPVTLRPPQRYLVMLGAVCDGWCATYDTQRAMLTPIALSPG